MQTNILDLLALIIQIFGTFVMVCNAPKNEPKGAFLYSGNPDYATPKKRESRTRCGFFLLGLGFLIQLVSLVIKIY